MKYRKVRAGDPLPSPIQTVVLPNGKTYINRDDVVHWLRRNMDSRRVHPRARNVLNDVIGMLDELGDRGIPAAHGTIDPDLDHGETAA